MTPLKVLISSALVALTTFATAADRDIFTHKDAAIRGYDAVSYFGLEQGAKAVKGDPSIAHEYKGSTWHFSSTENRDLFIANPEKYAPQYGGYCAFAVSHGFTKPTDPNAWDIVDGKLYLNLSKRVQRKWSKTKAESIVAADNNWPNVLTACEAKGNCYK